MTEDNVKYSKYVYVCYKCGHVYRYDIVRCKQGIKNTIGSTIHCNGKVKMVKEEQI